MEPDNAPAYFGRSTAWSEFGMHEEAIADLDRAIELQPDDAAVDPNRALLDRRVNCDLLVFDEEIYQAVRRLSAKMCADPSVHGGKKRPSW